MNDTQEFIVFILIMALVGIVVGGLLGTGIERLLTFLPSTSGTVTGAGLGGLLAVVFALRR